MKYWIFVATVACASLTFAQQTEPPPEPKPQVVFSGQPQSPSPAAADHPATITDADRTAIVITAWDLDVHLAARQQSMEAQARVTLRNTSAAPLNQIALQLSSTLNFDMIGLRARKITFRENTVPSDADHTGQLHEAVIPLDAPLAPEASITLDVDYGGTIPLTAQRLTAIGAPDATAQASDWDRISEDFTGIRGFGNVVWYPVSSVPVSMGDGAKLFAEIGRQKLLDQDATASLRVTEEFLSQPPNAAILDGHYVNLDKPAAMPTASFPGVITASVPATRLGFETPSLFLARRVETYGNGLRVLALDADAASEQTYIDAAKLARPLVRTWLGNPKDSFTILDLPEPDDAPAEIGGLLATPLSTDDAPHLEPVVVHALAHGAFTSPRAYLNEGVAAFLGTLWIEANRGRTAAIENLNAGRPALTLLEPSTPGASAGEDLPHATSPAFYRTKAMYVLWMLRDIAGDKALQSALQSYDAAQDTKPDYFEHLLEKASGKDLRWFFDDWVNRDPGLPDLSIAEVYPSREAHQTVLVAIEIVNDGYAEAEVPVTVKGVDSSVTQRVRVPAHGRVSYRITFQEIPTEVDLNDGTVPEVEASIHRKLLSAQ
ncbi:MAG: hypothetical protein WBE63_19115 [Acidobacteriaceae bacterium]